MNIYKKTVITLGIAFVTISQISNALDTDGTAITNALKTMYVNNFMPNKILTNTDLTQWFTVINGAFSNYVVKNSTVAGIKDTLLIQSLTNLTETNKRMYDAIAKSRKDINVRSTFAMETLKENITALEKIKSEIIAIETPLKKESYFIPSKKNAKEALLFVLEYMRGATETAIAQVKKNIASGY